MSCSSFEIESTFGLDLYFSYLKQAIGHHWQQQSWSRIIEISCDLLVFSKFDKLFRMSVSLFLAYYPRPSLHDNKLPMISSDYDLMYLSILVPPCINCQQSQINIKYNKMPLLSVQNAFWQLFPGESHINMLHIRL